MCPEVARGKVGSRLSAACLLSTLPWASQKQRRQNCPKAPISGSTNPQGSWQNVDLGQELADRVTSKSQDQGENGIEGWLAAATHILSRALSLPRQGRHYTSNLAFCTGTSCFPGSFPFSWTLGYRHQCAYPSWRLLLQETFSRVYAWLPCL